MGEGIIRMVKGNGIGEWSPPCQGDCRNAAASLPPRSGADGSRVCGCTPSFCLPQELAKEWVVELVSSPTSANEQPLFGESPEMRVLESWNEMARVDFVVGGGSNEVGYGK